jgi:hypothetical protein
MVPNDIFEKAWKVLAENMGFDPEDRGAFETELMIAFGFALASVTPDIIALADDEGYDPGCQDYARNKP